VPETSFNAPEHQHSKVDTAHILGIHRKTLERAVRNGEIGCVRIGRRIFFTDAQIRAYQDAHTIDATAAV
jgi:excisionase family DNA binding protein